MIELANDNLKEIINDNESVIVQYGAAWCGNCRLIKPKFKKLSGEYEDVKFIYVDAEKSPDSRSLAQVHNLPTFAGFKKGQLIESQAGNKETTIKDILNAVTSN